MSWKRKLWALVFALCCWPGGARAEGPSGWLEEDRDWSAGSIRTQLDRDSTPIPFGKGAVFVPSMMNPLDEPPVAVLQGGKVVAQGTTGRRIPLAPGDYQLRIGSGAEQDQLNVEASVAEGKTTVLPVTWAGLTVHVVDEAYSSERTAYELINLSTREHVGIGFGADEQAGEPVSTWILRPGLYKLVRLGENYRARRDFSTVRLLPGQHAHFLLVVDPDEATFVGGGEVPLRELFNTYRSFGSLLLSGDVTLHSRKHDPTTDDGWGATVRGFVDGRFGLRLWDNPLVIQLQLEEGQTKTPNERWSKSSDFLDVDALYVYRIAPWIGPYARFGAETNLLSNIAHLSEAADIYTLAEDAPDPQAGVRPTGSPQATSERFKLSPSFGTIRLKEGVGINLRVLKMVAAELTFRTGLGARHRINRHLYEEVMGIDSAGQPARAAGQLPIVIYRELPSTNQIGLEATMVATGRLSRWVVINLELDTLFPFNGDREAVIEGDLTVGLKLTSFASINYVLRVLRDKTISADDRISQDVLFRLSVELL